MAGTVQPVQVVSDAGVTLTDLHASAALANEIPVNARTLVIITAGAAAVNVTLNDYTTVDGMSVTDRVINIPLGTTKIIGPVPVGVYGLADNNWEFDIDVLANVAKMFLIEVP